MISRNEIEYWWEYISTAWDEFRQKAPLDHNTDPMRVEVEKWLGRIEMALSDAKLRGCMYVLCYLRSAKVQQRIVMRFSDGDGKKFERSLSLAQIRREGRPLSEMDVLNLQIALQSEIISRSGLQPDPRGGWLGFRTEAECTQ